MKRTILSLSLVVSAAAALHAGEPAPPAPVPFLFERAMPAPPLDPADVVFIRAHEGFELKTVKGAPYTAEAVNEAVQVLADGNRIVRRTTSTVARDGEGRTRREQDGGFGLPGFADGHRTAFVNDPVAKVRWVLDLEDRSAQRMDLPVVEFDAPRAEDAADDGPVRGVEVENVIIRVEPPTPPAAPAPPDAPEAPTPRIHRRIVHGGPLGPDMRGMPLPMPPSAEHPAQKEALGTRTIEGVEAEGTRTVTTIPAGEIGNERALEIVSERWYSKQLQGLVMTRHVDPRFGETTWKLTNVALGEPDRSLFEVPSDFKVESLGGHSRVRIHKR